MRSCLELRESVSRSGSPEKAGTDSIHSAAWAGSCCWILHHGSRAPAVSVEVVLQGPCCTQCQLFRAGTGTLLCILRLLHAPWLLGGIIPNQRVAGGQCGPKERAGGAMQRAEKLQEIGKCSRDPGRGLSRAAQGQRRANGRPVVCASTSEHRGHGWPCLSLPARVAPVGSPSPYGCGCL